MNKTVLVVGDVMTDIIVIPEGPIVTGSDRRAEIRSRPGGSGANQAVWLGAMGADVRFAARVGAAEKAGHEAYFAGFGVQAFLAADHQHAGGILVTLLAPDGERSFLTDRGANLHLCAEDLPETLLDGVGMVMISGYSLFAPGPRAAVLALLETARKRGISVAIDPASVGFLHEVGVAQFLDWTKGADWIFANQSEAEALTQSVDIEQQILELGALFTNVVIKRGPAGAALGGRTGTRVTLPAQTVPVLDTTGAGDAFAAGFLAAHVSGDDEATALAKGILAGAKAVQSVGGQPPSSSSM